MAQVKSVTLILVIFSLAIQRSVVETLVVETGDSINNLQKIADDYMKEIRDRIWWKSENRKLVTDTDYLIVSKSKDPNGSSSSLKYYNGNGSTQWRLSPRISNSVILPFPESTTKTQSVESQTLHPSKKPFIAFRLTSNQLKHHFAVDSNLDRNYYISVVLEKMNCSERKWVEMYSDDKTVPKLSVEKSDNKIVEWCTEVDNSVYNFQSVNDFTNGDKSVTVTGTGNWTNLSASVVVSIYYETSKCSECTENNHFCCGTEYSSCTKGVIRELRDDSQPQPNVRCIPMKSENGSSLRCNRHPNCGFHCNPDESHAICNNGGSNDDDYCVGYYCYNYQQDRTILTILLLIFCCVLIPFGVFLLCCSRKDIRRECLRGRDRGRCPLPLEIALCPFSIDPEDNGAIRTRRNRHNHNNHEMRNRPRGNQRRGATRRSEEVNSSSVPEMMMVPPPPPAYDNFSYLDDLPPPYSECVSNKSLYPVPPPVPVTGISTISRNSVTPVPVNDFDLHHHRRPMFTGAEVQAIAESNDESQSQQEKEIGTRARTVADAETAQIQPAISTITVENDLGAGAGSNAGQNSRPVCRCNISISI